MTDAEIVQRLHEGFRSGAIPRSMPIRPVRDLQGLETVVVNGGHGQLCSACGERIGLFEQGSIEYRYPAVATWFHQHCGELWLAEREKPLRRA